MEIIDTFRKALKLQIHTVIFIFPSKKHRTLWLSQNCLSTLQFSFWHTFPPPQLRRVFFPAPSKGTGSLGRDFASRISSSLGGEEGSQGLTQARRTLRRLFTPGLARRPCPGLTRLGRLRPGDAAPSARSTLFFSEPAPRRELGYGHRRRHVLPSTLVTVPFVVTELSTQGSLLLKLPGTPLIFPAPRERTPCHWAGLPLLPPLGPMWDAGCGMWDVGCGMLSPSQCSKRRGEAAHPKTHLPLTHSAVDSCNNKLESSPCSQSWSWPSLCKMDPAKARGDWELFAQHPTEGGPALPPQTPPNPHSPTAFRWSCTAAEGALPGRSGWQRLFSLQQQHAE